MKVAEFIKRYTANHRIDSNDSFTWDHSLRSLAHERANHPTSMHTGTVYDWEDLERYQQELDRMDREGIAQSGSQ